MYLSLSKTRDLIGLIAESKAAAAVQVTVSVMRPIYGMARCLAQVRTREQFGVSSSAMPAPSNALPVFDDFFFG